MKAAGSLAAAVAWLLAASAALAAPPTPTSPPPPSLGSDVANQLEDVVVIGRPPGPAMWVATKGNSQVVIIGAHSPLPHMLAWPSGRVERALAGAKVLLLPPSVKPGLFDLVMLKFDHGAVENSRGRTLDQLLPYLPDKRLHDDLAAIRGDYKKYEKLKPVVAGVQLISDARLAWGFSNAKPGSTIKHLAEAQHVPVREVGKLKFGSLVRIGEKLSEAESLRCFNHALDEFDWERSRAREAAAAWGDGKLRDLAATHQPAGLLACLMEVPGTQAMVDQGIEDARVAADEALEQPGKTVMVVDLNFLLTPNGLLDRLKATGATISLPPG